jgi:hypothetical protein
MRPPSPLAPRAIRWLVAPDATLRECTVTLAAAALGAVAAALLVRHRVPGAGALRIGLATLIAFDFFGGAVGNCADSCKRHWHGRGRSAGQALGFVAGHLVHVALVAWAFRAGDLAWAGTMAALLLAGAAAVLASPADVRRSVAALAFAAALAADAWLGPTPGLEWFAAILFFKLLVAHLLPEGALAGTAAIAGASAAPPRERAA